MSIIDRLIAHGTKLAALHVQVGTKGLKVSRVPDCLTMAQTWASLVAEVEAWRNEVRRLSGVDDLNKGD